MFKSVINTRRAEGDWATPLSSLPFRQASVSLSGMWRRELDQATDQLESLSSQEQGLRGSQRRLRGLQWVLITPPFSPSLGAP